MKMKTILIILLSTGFAGTGYSAETDQFKECAAIRMKEIKLKHLESGDPEHFTQVPKGWTVISGGGGEGHPKLLICR